MAEQKQSMTYFGILRAPTSWAKVARELLCALVRQGVRLNIYERKGFLYNPQHVLPHELTARIKPEFTGHTTLTFEHPKTYHLLGGQRKIGILTYESTVVPPLWVEQVNRYLDLLLVPSHFCRQLFRTGGVAKEKVQVLPHGYNPEIYFPSDAAKRPWGCAGKFAFLVVASPHKREGLDLLLKAYYSAFTKGDRVSLVVKLNYLPGSKKKPFEVQHLEHLLRPQPGRPALVVVRDFVEERQMAELYQSADCYVSATRGEGFGLPFLEALACGLPVIATGWSGHLDFLSADNALLVKHRLVGAKEIQYDNQSTQAQIALPNTTDLAKKMRLAYDAPSKIATADKRALQSYTWSHIARQLLSLMR